MSQRTVSAAATNRHNWRTQPCGTKPPHNAIFSRTSSHSAARCNSQVDISPCIQADAPEGVNVNTPPCRPRAAPWRHGQAAAAIKLTKPELLRRLAQAGKKPKGAHKLLVGELLALCKRYKLASDAGLMDMDADILRCWLTMKTLLQRNRLQSDSE